MAEETQDLLVRVSPEGTGETSEELDNVSDSFEDAADTAEESAGPLEDFADRWQGAMQVAVAALTVAAAGLLSQVPVLSEAMNGLFAVVRAVAFQMDKVLRPVLGPISIGFARLASAIARLEGPAGIIVGVLGVLGSALAVVIGYAFTLGSGFATLSAIASSVVGAFSSISSAITAIVAAIGAFLAGIGSFPLLVGVAISAVLLAIYLFRDELIAAFQTALDGMVEISKVGWNLIIEAFAIGIGGIVRAVNSFINEALFTFEKFWIMTKAGFALMGDFIVKALKTAFNLAIDAVEFLTNKVISAVNSIISAIESIINAAAEAASEVPGVSISNVNLGRVEETSLGGLETRSTQEIIAGNRRQTNAALAGAQRSRQQRARQLEQGVSELVQAIRGQKVETELNLDGRAVADDVEQFIGKESADAGRTGGE